MSNASLSTVGQSTQDCSKTTSPVALYDGALVAEQQIERCDRQGAISRKVVHCRLRSPFQQQRQRCLLAHGVKKIKRTLVSSLRKMPDSVHSGSGSVFLACASGTATNTTPPGLRTDQNPSKLLLAWRACKCSKLGEEAISVCN